jgi:hypothetical protein
MGLGVAQKINKKGCPIEKLMSWEKESMKKKGPKRKKNY